MIPARQVFQDNVRILRSRASKQAIVGAIIAGVTVIAATLFSAYFINHFSLTLQSVVEAQSSNPVLWFLDFTPFIFSFWGQYTSTVMAYEAGAMIMDQTDELRTYTATLEGHISHKATHDALTDLPNRALFMDRLDQALQMAQSSVGVIFLDLDGFKEINDTLGHYNGDRALKSVATRILNCVGDAATVARLGSDEFGLVLPRIKTSADVNRIAKAVRRALVAPYSLEGVTLSLVASIGAAVYPQHGKDADTLMQRAAIAMNHAKKEKSGYALYSPDYDAHSTQRLILVGELRQAIKRQELLLEYQPIMTADGHSIHGAEALVRWRHDRYGVIKPDEFIPLAERSGLVGELTPWVLRQALQDVAAWHDSGISMNVSVNVTAQNLLDPEFANVVAGLLGSFRLPDNPITLEITETTLLTDQMRALETVTQLKKLGVRTVIDDFGTGYSSLSYLRRLPITAIKIDRSFVSDMATGEGGEILVNAIIQLAHALQLHVTAEGVESCEVQRRLLELGCDTVQGYAISRPLDPAKMSKWLAHAIHDESVIHEFTTASNPGNPVSF